MGMGENLFFFSSGLMDIGENFMAALFHCHTKVGGLFSLHYDSQQICFELNVLRKVKVSQDSARGRLMPQRNISNLLSFHRRG